jgi:hypothetical protein
VVDGDIVFDLPLNFAVGPGAIRTPFGFLELMPGASNATLGVQESSGYGIDIRVNGMPNNSFKTLVDGQDTTNPYKRATPRSPSPSMKPWKPHPAEQQLRRRVRPGWRRSGQLHHQERQQRVARHRRLADAHLSWRYQNIRATTARLNYDHTLSPTLFNHAGFGVLRYENPDQAADPNFDAAGTRQLTIDYGVRYDVQPAQHEQLYRTASFDPELANPTNGGLKGALRYEGSGNGRCNCRFAPTYP